MSLLTPQERRVIYFLLTGILVGSAVLVLKKYTPYNIAPELKISSNSAFPRGERKLISYPIPNTPDITKPKPNVATPEPPSKPQGVQRKREIAQPDIERKIVVSPTPRELQSPIDKKEEEEKVVVENDPVVNYINEADKEGLMELPGIGKVLADRIIEYRERHGKFKRLEELKAVNGIGDKTIEKIKSAF